MGYELVVDFLPWSRAVSEAKNDASQYAGYFPEYYSDAVADEFVFSDPMGSGPLGLVENKNNPVTWQTLEDLQPLVVGVVQDYVNTDEFDARVAQGKQKVQAVTSDATNIKKVAGNRVPVAIIDANVFAYLLKSDPSLKPFSEHVQMNEKILENKKLYICFKNNDFGKEIAQIFNEGLKKVDVQAIMKQYQ
ncbi:succinate dehydrogenase [Oleiphilus messinensis]|uniref:Succinate dehydrogenase n=1 Tax=Oleiphilus messinensis TaxID=141451 RepID=A0A1Y0IDX6_9GAMM|nr:succinate dehydrogenase [Oleiphilus messinensis]